MTSVVGDPIPMARFALRVRYHNTRPVLAFTHAFLPVLPIKGICSRTNSRPLFHIGERRNRPPQLPLSRPDPSQTGSQANVIELVPSQPFELSFVYKPPVQ